MAKSFIYNFGRTVVNGKVISGSVITIENGRMLVDGKPFEDWSESDEKVINITINGNVDTLDVVSCSSITISGDAKKVKTGSGDVSVKGSVSGDVHTGSGNVECKDVEGDVSTGSGNVRCGNVRGRVSTGMGNVYHQ